MGRATDTINAAQLYAREVAAEMLTMRGWTRMTAPVEVLTDIFETLDRHSALFSRGYCRAACAKATALAIQNREWDGR